MLRHYRLLGGLTIEDDGRLSPVMNYSKGCALLAYLIVTGQPQSREVMADFLWEAASSDQAFRNLRATLYKLRPLVPELVVSKSRLAFKGGDDIEIDFLQLQAALENQDTYVLEAALPLYKGDLLDGFYLDDVPLFWEWLLLERENLRQRVWTGYNQLCDAYEKQQAWQKGIDAVRRWLALDMLDEAIHRQMMKFLAADGQVEEALAQYERCCQILWEELGAEPEPATTAVVTELEQLTLPAQGELAPPGPLPSLSCVPYRRNNDFVGRSESLLFLASQLIPQMNRDQHRVTAITGIGGMGKTQLTVEFCYRYGRFFPGGVFWLNFANAAHVAEEISQIGGERGMRLYHDSENLRQTDKVGRVVRAWQEPIPRLLIFDNCEEPALLQKWLPVSGGCSVLVTSRRANWPRELHLVERELRVLDTEESVRFLQNLATDLTITDAAKIATELDHLPLALHLAGGFLRRYRQISAEQYLSQLRDKTIVAHPSLKGRGIDMSPTGHELDVVRTFEINWEQLMTADETDKIALKLLANAAMFAPGEAIPHDLLFSTVGKDENDLTQILLVEDGLTRLITLGFIRKNRADILSLHRLVVAFVQTMLPDLANIQTAVAQTVWQHIKGQWGIGMLLDQLVVPPTHVKFLMEVELAKQTAPGVHLTHAWGRHLLDIGDFTNSRNYLEKALATCEKVYGVDQLETADVLLDLGTLAWYSGSDQAAWEPYQRAYRIFKQHLGEVHFRTGNSLMTFAILYARAGEYDAAITNYQEALTIFAQVLPPDDPIVGLTLHNMGDAYRRMGQHQVALSKYEECLRIRRKIWSDDHPRILTTMSSIGLVYFRVGDYQSSLDYFTQAYEGRLKRLGEHHHQTVYSLSNLATALGYLGRYEESISHLNDALKIQEKIFGLEHPNLVYTLTYLGDMLKKVGEIGKASQVGERALTILEANSIENEETAETLTYLAAILIQGGEMEKAQRYLTRAQEIWEQRPELIRSQAAATIICWGEWWEFQGDINFALTYYEEALTILTGRVAETHDDLQRLRAHLTRLKPKA